MLKKIAFVYDTQDTYGITDRISYSDFCYIEEVKFIGSMLKSKGYSFIDIEGPKAFLDLYCNGLNIDIVFNKCEGFNSRNREGLFPAILEFLEIPFIGTDSYGLSLSLNKCHTKLIAENIGVNTPKFILIEKKTDLEKDLNISFPVILKPNSEGSSMGVKIVFSKEELFTSVDELSVSYGFPLLCEEYIFGNEVSVPIVGTGDNANALGAVEFVQNDGSLFSIYSTEAKYYLGCKSIMYSNESDLTVKLKNDALNIYRSIGCRDFGRVDFRIKDGVPYLLEVNPLPTLSKDGSFDLCAQYNNESIADVLDEIIKSAAIRYM